MNPTTFAGAMLVLVASTVLSLGAILLIAWGFDQTYVSSSRRRRQLVSAIIGGLTLLLIAIYWLSTPLFRGGCC